MVAEPDYDEVVAVYHGGDPVEAGDLTQSQADQAISEATSMFNNVFDTRVLFTSSALDDEVGVRLLARHKLDLALGNTIQSEGQAGATVNYNVPADTARSLMRTNPGQEFIEYLRNEPNISVFRTDR